MKISTIIEFLEGVKETDGDLEVSKITGFWVIENPKPGNREVVFSIGQGRPVR